MAELNTVIVTEEDMEMQPERDDELKTDLQARLKQMQDKMNEMELKVNNMDQLTKDLDGIKANLHVQTERLDNCEMQLKAIDKKVDDNEERITATGTNNKVTTINNKPTTLDIWLFNSIGRKIPSEYIGITKTIQKLQNLGKFGTLREKDGRLVSEFTWDVKNIEEEIAEAKDDDEYYIESDPFYTNVPGYRVKLCLYPNDLKSNHIGVYLYLVEGEFDDLVSWPFNCEYELYSVGRDGTRFASFTFDPSTITDGDNCFDQPPNGDGGYGATEYIKSDQLLANKDQYLIDGDLKIKASIRLIN